MHDLQNRQVLRAKQQVPCGSIFLTEILINTMHANILIIGTTHLFSGLNALPFNKAKTSDPFHQHAHITRAHITLSFYSTKWNIVAFLLIWIYLYIIKLNYSFAYFFVYLLRVCTYLVFISHRPYSMLLFNARVFIGDKVSLHHGATSFHAQCTDVIASSPVQGLF